MCTPDLGVFGFWLDEGSRCVLRWRASAEREAWNRLMSVALVYWWRGFCMLSRLTCSPLSHSIVWWLFSQSQGDTSSTLILFIHTDSSEEVKNGSISIPIHQYPQSSRGPSSAAKTWPTRFEDLKMRFNMLVHDAKIDTIEKVEENIINWYLCIINPVVASHIKYLNTTCREALDSTESKTRNGTVRSIPASWQPADITQLLQFLWLRTPCKKQHSHTLQPHKFSCEHLDPTFAAAKSVYDMRNHVRLGLNIQHLSNQSALFYSVTASEMHITSSLISASSIILFLFSYRSICFSSMYHRQTTTHLQTFNHLNFKYPRHFLSTLKRISCNG